MIENIIYLRYKTIYSSYQMSYSDVGDKFMLMILWWWQFQDICGKIITLSFFIVQNRSPISWACHQYTVSIIYHLSTVNCHQHQSPTSVTNISHQHRFSFVKNNRQKHQFENRSCLMFWLVENNKWIIIVQWWTYNNDRIIIMIELIIISSKRQTNVCSISFQWPGVIIIGFFKKPQTRSSLGTLDLVNELKTLVVSIEWIPNFHS